MMFYFVMRLMAREPPGSRFWIAQVAQRWCISATSVRLCLARCVLDKERGISSLKSLCTFSSLNVSYTISIMSFTLANVIDLLEALESLHTAVPPLSLTVLSRKTLNHITSWFEFYLPTIRNNPQTLVSIFSFLLPGLRPDRIYALREPSLSRIIGKCLLLGPTRQNALSNWRLPEEGDFGSVVQRVMA